MIDVGQQKALGVNHGSPISTTPFPPSLLPSTIKPAYGTATESASVTLLLDRVAALQDGMETPVM
jgi:hypothetical protein